jgi:prepilin-type N-terminal cleavage/methylation domain-containing protein
MTRKKGYSSGFSLIETMVCLVVASLVLVATYQFFVVHHQSYKGQSERLVIQDNVRDAMDFVSRSMKEAVAFPGAVGGTDSLTFSVREDFGRSSGTNTGTTLNDTAQSWTADQWTNHRVVITNGSGKNEVRTIDSNTSNQLTVSSAWSITPDETSEYKIISDRQFSRSGTALQYQNTTTGANAVLADNITSFSASRNVSQVTITMTGQTDRVIDVRN